MYATGTGDNALAVFSRDVVSGELTFVQELDDDRVGMDGLGGARWVTLDPTGTHVYVAGSYGELGVFTRNASSGELTLQQAIHYLDPGIDGSRGPAPWW